MPFSKIDELEINKNYLEKATQNSLQSSQNCKLLNEDQWSKLNEQIKQISLDSSKQHARRLKTLVSDIATASLNQEDTKSSEEKQKIKVVMIKFKLIFP
jgi:hypothetical protein